MGSRDGTDERHYVNKFEVSEFWFRTAVKKKQY